LSYGAFPFCPALEPLALSLVPQILVEFSGFAQTAQEGWDEIVRFLLRGRAPTASPMRFFDE